MRISAAAQNCGPLVITSPFCHGEGTNRRLPSLFSSVPRRGGGGGGGHSSSNIHKGVHRSAHGVRERCTTRCVPHEKEISTMRIIIYTRGDAEGGGRGRGRGRGRKEGGGSSPTSIRNVILRKEACQGPRVLVRRQEVRSTSVPIGIVQFVAVFNARLTRFLSLSILTYFLHPVFLHLSLLFPLLLFYYISRVRASHSNA